MYNMDIITDTLASVNIISLHRSLSQTKEHFRTFIKDLEVNLEHIVNKSQKSISDFSST